MLDTERVNSIGASSSDPLDVLISPLRAVAWKSHWDDLPALPSSTGLDKHQELERPLELMLDLLLPTRVGVRSWLLCS